MSVKKVLRPYDAFVLDASVTLSWFFDDEFNEYAKSVRNSLEIAAAFSPSIWILEVANSLLMGERRKRATEAQTTEFSLLLLSLPIVVDEQADNFVRGNILSLARQHNLSAYDASYLELAARRGLALATLDRRLQTAAKKAGIALFKP